MKFDMGKAWSEAVEMISANREVLLVLAGIFFLLPSLVMALLGPDLGAIFTMDPAQLEQLSAMMSAIYARWWWLFAMALAAQLTGYLAMLALLRDDTQPTVADAIGGGLKALLPAFAAYLIFVIGASLAFALLVGLAAALGAAVLAGLMALVASLLVIYLLIKVSLAAPVIAIEKVMNPFAVLARSWQLTKGNSLRLFAFYFLLMIAYVVVSAVLGIVVLALAAVLGDGAGRIVTALVSGLVGTMATVVLVAVLAATHRQLAGPSTAAISQTFS